MGACLIHKHRLVNLFFQCRELCGYKVDGCCLLQPIMFKSLGFALPTLWAVYSDLRSVLHVLG